LCGELVDDSFREGILDVRGVVLIAWPVVGQHLLHVHVMRIATSVMYGSILTQALLRVYRVVGMDVVRVRLKSGGWTLTRRRHATAA
jgi:hypothetical protein